MSDTHPAEDPTGAARHGAPSVLVVEDDEKLARVIRAYLARSGLDATVAPTGDLALRSMREQAPAAVVLDVMIPHPDGIEVCRQLRRDGWTGPVIAISARNSPTDRARVLAAGADEFLAKPFRLSLLAATLLDHAARLGATDDRSS